MTWLTLIFALEAGMVPGNLWYLYEADAAYESEPGYYTTMEAEAQVGGE